MELMGPPNDTEAQGALWPETSGNQWRWGNKAVGVRRVICLPKNFVCMRCCCDDYGCYDCCYPQSHCVQPAVTFNYRCLWLQILAPAAQPSLALLLPLKGKSIHIRLSFVSLLFKQNPADTGRVNSCYASWVIKVPTCGSTLFPLRVLKDTNVSRTEDGQSKFEVQVVRLWCAAPAPGRLRGPGVAGVCRWAYWPPSSLTIFQL